MNRKPFFFLFAAAMLTNACMKPSRDAGVESHISPSAAVDLTAPERPNLAKEYRIDNLTPTGRRVFESALFWIDKQWEYRNSQASRSAMSTPSPRMCAGNVSQVLYMTGIDSLLRYRYTAVDEVVSAVENASGGKNFHFPKSQSGIVRMLNSIYGGRVPVGALVGGCLQVDANNVCVRIDGSRHIGLIGNTELKTRNGKTVEVIMAYHNNWYRPDNAGGQFIAPFMVSQRNLRAGFPRQWMATPWLEIERDPATGLVKSARTPLINPTTNEAAVDDMDPFTYNVFVSVIPEIVNDLNGGKSYLADGAGNELPLTKWGNISFSARGQGRAMNFDISVPDADEIVLLVDRFQGEFRRADGNRLTFSQTFSSSGSRLMAVYGYRDGRVIAKGSYSFNIE